MRFIVQDLGVGPSVRTPADSPFEPHPLRLMNRRVKRQIIIAVGILIGIFALMAGIGWMTS